MLMLALGACGGGGGGTTPTAVTQPPTPSAAITAVGAGNLVIHPSVDTRFCCAMEAPIRISETGGGTADWNFVRMQIIKGGREIERFELGATSISAAGYSRVTANSSNVRTPILRLNSTDFDRIDLTLGLSDLKDARQFTVAVPFDSFTDVALSLTPLSLPDDGSDAPGH
jgi:hypothetical protein